MEHFRVRPLSEEDIDGTIKAAGGERAHTDEDRRDKPGSDYRLAETLLELKSLDDEGLEKPERQSKLAALFREHSENRPVVVLDRESLPSDAQRSFDRILEGPIKSAVAKARKQLKQSKVEHPDAKAEVPAAVSPGGRGQPPSSAAAAAGAGIRDDAGQPAEPRSGATSAGLQRSLFPGGRC